MLNIRMLMISEMKNSFKILEYFLKEQDAVKKTNEFDREERLLAIKKQMFEIKNRIELLDSMIKIHDTYHSYLNNNELL